MRITWSIFGFASVLTHLNFTAAFQCQRSKLIRFSKPSISHTSIFSARENVNEIDHSNNEVKSRRKFVAKSMSTIAFSIGSSGVLFPSIAKAGIDVSGLPVDGRNGAGSISQQLRDVQQTTAIKTPATPQTTSAPRLVIDPSIAVSARRLNSSPPILKKSALGTIARLDETVIGPPDSSIKYALASFEFPSDWLQIDRLLGGIQFVDQRNGDKLYLLQSKLPSGTNLETVPKQFFSDSIFDPKGSIASGITIDEYKVSSSTTTSQIVNCPQSGACSVPRRRLKMKYSTVTGNGLRVERRALVDAYELEGWVYMLMVTQNAVKFEAKGKERETVENIVDSFRFEA